MPTSSPCKDCPDRQLGCHSLCEKYLAYARERDKINRNRQVNLGVTETIIKGQTRMRDPSRRRRK